MVITIYLEGKLKTFLSRSSNLNFPPYPHSLYGLFFFFSFSKSLCLGEIKIMIWIASFPLDALLPFRVLIFPSRFAYTSLCPELLSGPSQSPVIPIAVPFP